MNSLSPALAIDVWESARGLHPVDRAVALIGAALRGGPSPTAYHEVAALTVGRRDRTLLRLRQATFGDRIEALTRCPACGEPLEIELACSALLDGETGTEDSPAHELRFTHDGFEVTFRLPDSRDLAVIAVQSNVEAARQTLLDRCVLHVLGPAGIEVADLPTDLGSTIADAMAAADPCADIRLDLSCPECAHAWETALDPASLLWSEVDRLARRSLLEVDRLARAYSWTEREIFALSPARRATYLELTSEARPPA